MNRYRTRRATTDDLQQLITLWQAAQLPALELEKRFTEFQVVEDAEGKLVAATGLELVGHDGRIHSESFADFSLTDAVRPLLWDRFQSIAKNNGLCRIWTDETAPYWKKDAGFIDAPVALVQQLPESFGPRDRPWIYTQLRPDSALPASIDQQFQMFKDAEQAKREDIFRRARTFKTAALIISAALFFFAAYELLLFWTRHR